MLNVLIELQKPLLIERRGWVRAAMTAFALALGACATESPISRPLPVTPPSPPPAESHLILNQGNLLSEKMRERAAFDVDNDPLYRLLVAEFAGQRGQMDVAVDQYAAIARQLRSLDVAKRATRIAVFARDNEAALAAAKIWVEKAPSDTEARQILAAMHIRAGDADAAIGHLEYVLNVDDDKKARQLRMIANLLSREEDKQTALAVMERIMVGRNDDPDALVAYTLLAIRAADVPRSTAAIERMMQAGKADPAITMAYVGLVQKSGKPREAVQWLQKAIAKTPDNTNLRLIYARLLADTNQYEQARIQFSLVADKTPDNSDVVYALGLLNLQANRIDAAHKNFSRLLTLKVRADDANFYLGQIDESRELAESAIAHYQAVTAGANHFQAQVRIALIYSSQQRVEDAQAQLRSLMPETEVQRLHLVRAEGEILTQHERYEAAMELYDGALVDTYDMELLYTRAMLAEKLGKLDVLESDLKRIIEREPNNAQALNALGYTLADHTQRYEEAYGYIERAFAINPNDFYILDSMGWALYRLGRLDEAVDYLTRARSLKEDPEVAAHLGEVLWVMGDKAGARDVWDSALKDKPDDQRLLDVIQRLNP